MAEEAGLAVHLVEDLTEEEEISLLHSLQMASINSEDVVEVSEHVPSVETEQLLGTVSQSMTVRQHQKTLNNFTKEHFDKLHCDVNISCSEESLIMPDFQEIDFGSENIVGGRLSLAAANWEKISTNPWVLNVVKHGYRLEFAYDPPLTSIPIFDELPLPPKQHQAVRDQVFELLTQGAVEKVDDPFSPRFYSKLFVREKKTTGPVPEYRLIIDLSKLNEYLVVPHFTMETHKSVRRELRPGVFFCKLDLRHAYLHILIDPRHRKYLSFVLDGQVYQWVSLPFGLAASPYVFTKVVAEVSKFVHTRGLNLLCYLDDWIMMCLLFKLGCKQRDYLLQILWYLGWLVNWKKSILDLLQITEYLGAQYNSLLMKVFPTQDRWLKIQSVLTQFLTLQVAPARSWCQILGLLTSTQEFTPLGQLALRPLQFHLNFHWRHHRKNLFYPIPITAECKTDLKWWLDPKNVLPGVPWTPPPPELTLTSDASQDGWGAHMGSLSVKGVWSPQEKKFHINWKELKSIHLAIQFFQSHISNKSLLIKSDNIVALAYLEHKGGTRSWTLFALAREILLLLHSLNTQITVQHISGHLNTWADILSRPKLLQATEWSLHPSVVQAIFQIWGTPQIDLFATKFNFKLPIYCSIRPDPQAYAIDSLSCPWTNMVAYAYPPPRIIPLVLNKIENQPCQVFLICPLWPRAPWFTRLLDLMIAVPLKLPVFHKLLKQPQTHQMYHPNPERLSLHAWKLSSITSLREDFLKKLSRELPTDTESLQALSMRPNGSSTFIGVIKGMPIHSNPLSF